MNINNVFLSLVILSQTVNVFAAPSFMKSTNLEKINKQYRNCELESALRERFKSGIEKWDICYTNNQTKIITIKYFKKTVKYEESYFIRSGIFKYAFEQETDQLSGSSWNCKFGIINEKEAMIISSLGHGKTEDDNWDPNEIIGMYETRLKQLKELEKK